MSTIGLVSDIHLGKEEVPKQEVISGLDRLVDEFERRDVTGVILLGDQIHEQSEEEDMDNLKTVRDKFNGFEFSFSLIGNHDIGNISKEVFASVMNTPTDYMISVDERDIVLLDTGSVNSIQNVGEISAAGLDLCLRANNPIVFSHFPVTYTDKYQDSVHFGEYPEGVFAINKYYLEQLRHDGDFDPNMIINGHLHLEHDWTDKFGCSNKILSPFMDFNENRVTGAGAVLDVSSLELETFTV